MPPKKGRTQASLEKIFDTVTSSTQWVGQAACAGMDTDLWFPNHKTRYPLAKTICDTCPVVNQCGQWALDNGFSWGMWGGLTPEDRGHDRSRF